MFQKWCVPDYENKIPALWTMTGCEFKHLLEGQNDFCKLKFLMTALENKAKEKGLVLDTVLQVNEAYEAISGDFFKNMPACVSQLSWHTVGDHYRALVASTLPAGAKKWGWPKGSKDTKERKKPSKWPRQRGWYKPFGGGMTTGKKCQSKNKSMDESYMHHVTTQKKGNWATAFLLYITCVLYCFDAAITVVSEHHASLTHLLKNEYPCWIIYLIQQGGYGQCVFLSCRRLIKNKIPVT